MDEILFPHNKIRTIQDSFLKDVVKHLKERKNLIAHAPTGLGKTTILGPALSYALQNKKTVFFVTPLHTQHRIAVETLKKIKEKYKLNFTAIDIIGKKWMCLQSGVRELTSAAFSEYCRNMIENGTCEFYTNMKKRGKLTVETRKMIEEIKKKSPIKVEEMCEMCKEKELCPYETAMLTGGESRVIIGDYFHVLSKPIRENLLKKMNKDLRDCILVFDEAHNIPSKARDLLTAELSTFIVERAVREAKDIGYEAIGDDVKTLGKMLERFAKEKTTVEKMEGLVKKEEFTEKIEDYNELIVNMKFIAEKVFESKKRSFCHSVEMFLEAWKGPDEGFARILSKRFDKRGQVVLALSYRCLDPSLITKEIATEARLICMSGTLTPTKMYKELLGIEAETKEYDDPFPKRNRLNIILPKTTTKFTKRGKEMYHKIAILTALITNKIPGNSAVYFPSYQIRDDVNKYFQTLSEKTTFLERKGLSKEERDEMLENFKNYNRTGAVLLGVSSGSFGEGIDLYGDFLKGVVIVGLPLGKPDLETEELIKYYDKRFGKGWDYGYVYPAILRAVQNAGRCIRSKSDRGVIVFLDERYSWKRYYDCFPKDWNFRITKMPITLIEEFFNKT